MTTVDKVTVSLPIELSACIDQRRAESGVSRSEVVTDLCWRGWRQWDEERRTRRSEAAYNAVPEPIGRQGWAGAAADTMSGWEPWDGPEAAAEIENERAEMAEKVRRLAAEPGAEAFAAAVRLALEQPPARAAG